MFFPSAAAGTIFFESIQNLLNDRSAPAGASPTLLRLPYLLFDKNNHIAGMPHGVFIGRIENERRMATLLRFPELFTLPLMSSSAEPTVSSSFPRSVVSHRHSYVAAAVRLFDDHYPVFARWSPVPLSHDQAGLALLAIHQESVQYSSAFASNGLKTMSVH
jgi:hypothetical protein